MRLTQGQIDSIEHHVAMGNLTRRKHPTEDLWIYNYTARVQYGRVWNDTTKMCRGLIVDADWNVVARPFRKFFNWQELTATQQRQLVKKPCHGFEKLDGSLGIMYPTSDGWAVATRGSFDSDQARWATRWLRENHPDYSPPEEVTALFEIVYPENRIVVDYGSTRELFMLNTVCRETGALMGLDPEWPGFDAHRITVSDPMSTINGVLSESGRVDEGVVLVFDSKTIVKVKRPEYVRKHRLLSNLSEKSIWDHLRHDGCIEEFIVELPEEDHQWVRDVASGLKDEVARLADRCARDFQSLPDGKENRRAFAEAAQQRTAFPSVMFAMLDCKEWRAMLWDHVKPKKSEENHEE